MDIENQIHAIKEIVDNSEHVMIDEDKLFSFQVKNEEKIKLVNDTKENLNLIIQNLIKNEIIKYDNTEFEQTKIELEAAAKLIIHLIHTQTKIEYQQIIKYLSK